MANDKHVALLKKGAEAWNAWREKNPDIRPDLSLLVRLGEVNLSRVNLSGANLSGAQLNDADLNQADLRGANLRAYGLDPEIRTSFGNANLASANLSGADLEAAIFVKAYVRYADFSGANLTRAWLTGADFEESNLTKANLTKANLSGANLSGAIFYFAILTGARLVGADLGGANLIGANLSGADLTNAHLGGADLTLANLSGADLQSATLVNTNLTDADLTGCRIHGISAWGLKLKFAKQQNLVITRTDEPEITVDNIEVAQFLYLMLNNQKVREVIDTITSKVVLILGRFTDERKAVLDALREELRKRNYLPILFDFSVPATRDITETVSPWEAIQQETAKWMGYDPLAWKRYSTRTPLRDVAPALNGRASLAGVRPCRTGAASFTVARARGRARRRA
jgi:uncharacterized protein YjbI with pentapeptide repeats